ncbi:LPS assembly lipoprotein LptE [Pseudoxanthomonas sp. JBR18]|uniref:LPS-assembly lipoprotein LptE n=1 Tax=Pseudoxanthomonas sp. JBR18 TaxID=2969308 RepID=UPI002306AA10|nr:LPS assembly lipoprotein LptE [Pseudoxanthomonas sp. JBR18]WCE04300.1 LPS assembly lipoprotein LptE [Pseudoxanthomonas sp. JBR18]
MNPTPTLRLLAVILLAVSLSACGFHLRSKIALPSDLGPVKVAATDAYSPLARDLSVGLRGAGAIPADDAKAKVATLDIMSERWGDQPIALDEQGRALEYSLRYAVIFRFTRADGSELVPQQVVELSRDYVAEATNLTGATSEREILADELRRDMAQAILRRIDGVVRGVGRPGGATIHAAPVDEPVAPTP